MSRSFRNKASNVFTVASRRRTSRVLRRAYTLIELLVAITISSSLVLGVASVLTLSLKTLNLHQAPAAQVSASGKLILEISSDIDLATMITEQTATSISMEVPDRDGDQLPELIQYRFVPAQSTLERTTVYSTNPSLIQPVVIAHDVAQFTFEFNTRVEGQTPVPPDLVSDERLLVSHDDHPPAANTDVLMVSIGQTLTVQEDDRKTLLESMGYSVSTIEQDATQSEINNSTSVNDVAYVPSQIDASTLGDKLKATGIGVVSENIDSSETFGFGLADANSQSRKLLAMRDIHHFLGSQNLTGGLEIFADSQSVKGLSSDPTELAPALKTMGRWNSLPAYCCLDKHDELYTGGATGPPGEFGFQEVFSESVADLDKLHYATKVNITEGVNVISLSAYFLTTGKCDVRYAIYSDNNGEPDQLLAETDKQKCDGPNQWFTIPLMQETSLSPGDYWLAIGTQKKMHIRYESTGGNSRLADSESNPRDGMMEDWSTSIPLESDTHKLSIYASFTGVDVAKGRRVQLPWGDSFDINSLNEHGKQLLENAIDWAADQNPADESADFIVGDKDYVAQMFLPNLPANATAWEITRVITCIKPNPDEPDGKLQFALHEAIGPTDPGPMLQETDQFNTSQILESDYQWLEIPFQPTGKIDPGQSIALVIIGDKADGDATLKVDVVGDWMTSGTHLLKSTNGGNIWSYHSQDADLRFYVYGRVYTEGE